MAVPPILQLTPNWDITQSVSYDNWETELGDGYIQVAEGGPSSRTEKWSVRRTGLTKAQAFALHSELSVYAGDESFQWQPSSSVPFKIYTCKEWSLNPLGQNLWEISAEFVLDVSGECVQFLDRIDEAMLLGWISAMNTHLTTYTRSTSPLLINSQYLLVNSFHEVLGRGGYFPPSAGTTEGQYLAIRGCIAAYERTGNADWLNRAINMGNAAVAYFYLDGIPSNPATFWSPHWLVNVKSPFISKGLATAPDPLNYGYFDVVVNFVNGVGVIPSGGATQGLLVSDVYSVYAMGAKLLWQNVYAPVVQGTQYEIEYWVSNYLLAGQNYRVYPTTASSSGTPPTPTAETAGTVKLTTNFNGNLKVTYAAYVGSTIAVNQRFEAYPMWRPMLPGEIQCAFDTLWWAWDAYDDLFRVTGNTAWQRARDATLYSTVLSADIPNLTHFYKEDDNPDPFAYPGSQVVQVNNPNGYTASRQTTGDLTDFLRVQVAAAPAGNFPSCEVQNFAVVAQIDGNTTIRVNAAHSRDTLVEIVLSTSSDPFNFTELYICNWVLNASTTTPSLRTFLPGDFIRWRKASEYLVWYPTVAETPIYDFNGGGGTVDVTRLHVTLPEGGNDYFPVVYRIQLDNNSGFAGAGLVLNGKKIRRPPRMHYRHTGNDVVLRITDGEGNKYDRTITEGSGGWRKTTFSWGDFDWSEDNSSNDEEDPTTQADIQGIEFHAKDGAATIWIYWVSENDRNDPERLPYPCLVYKASFVSRDKLAHTFWLGNFRPQNSPSDDLQYNPGVVPFTVNSIDNVIDAWRGIPLTGYQSPYHWLKWGYTAYLNQCLDYLEAAQADYAQQNENNTTGPWTPAFSWAYWDNGDFLANGINGFGWSSPDPNTMWEGYMHRTVEAIAKAWMLEPTNQRLSRLTMKFLGWIDSFYFKRNSVQPPTNYREFVDPTVEYHCPHAAALIGRAALYANLAGGSPSITFRLIIRSLDYLESQYISTGPMAGSFTANQPVFNSIYRENFAFWAAEELIFFCELLKYKDQLRLPDCATIL